MAELSAAQKRKMISQLKKASQMHAAQAKALEKTLPKKKK
jgi:hypothetical protein